MRHTTYQSLLPFYMRARALNPVATANPEWMAQWWARSDEIKAHVDRLYESSDFAWATAFMKANPVVPITEESVLVPVPAVVYVDDPAWIVPDEF